MKSVPVVGIATMIFPEADASNADHPTLRNMKGTLEGFDQWVPQSLLI